MKARFTVSIAATAVAALALVASAGAADVYRHAKPGSSTWTGVHTRPTADVFGSSWSSLRPNAAAWD